MHRASTLVDNYEEHFRQIGQWKLQIVAYTLGPKYICIVNNLDPGATVCRVSDDSRDKALRKALVQANSLLSNTVYHDVQPDATQELVLSRLEYRDSETEEIFSVQEFIALQNAKRMEYILSGKLIYLGPAGEILPPGDAMRLLATGEHSDCRLARTS
jgi:hypothetical protein